MKQWSTSMLALALVSLSSSALAIGWIGNTAVRQSGQTFPRRGGFLEPWQKLQITTETWPIESGQRVVAVVETAGWQTAREYEFTWQRNQGNNSVWALDLGPFPLGTQVNFYLKGSRTGQSNSVFDSNGGTNYGYHQRFASPYRRGAVLQWFATDYQTILKRLPEVVDAGYTAIYLPSPVKSGGGGLSVGYNPVDRFDLGDRPQKGSVKTQYGTTQELIELIRVANRLGIEVYADMVINHNDNRASHPIDQYPDMIPEDFHIRATTNTGNSEVNFNTESAFSFGMLNHDLVGLTDIAHEDGNNTQTGTFTLPPYASFNAFGKPSFIRQPLTPQYYLNGQPVNEDVRQYLERWSKWMVEVIGFQGFRIDAVKHVPPGYFGWAPDQAASQGFSNGDLISRLFRSYPNLTIFGEAYSSNGYELREYAKTGMNLLDFPLKFQFGSVFNANGFGDLGLALGNGYAVDAANGLAYQQGGLTPDVSVSFVQSHDDGPPASTNLAHAFILARPGRPKIYFDGNNITPGNFSNFPRPGRGDALGAFGDTLLRMVDVQSRFGRGYSVPRFGNGNAVVFERQVNGSGVLLFGMSDRGDQGVETVTVQTGFPAGTVLTDYAGNQPDVTVGNGGSVTISIPTNFSSSEPNNGKGYVAYARKTARAKPGIRPVTLQERSLGDSRDKSGWVNAMTTVIPTPGGRFASGGSFDATTVRSNKIRLDVNVDEIGSSAIVRFNNGVALPGQQVFSNTAEGLADGFMAIDKMSNGRFLSQEFDISSLPDGLHRATVRVFSDTAGAAGAYNDFSVYFYVRRGLSTGWQVDGDLTDFGSPTASQSRNPSSNSNRLDALYVRNDAEYLYLGLAGRVDDREPLTNGIGLFLDTEPGAGLQDVSQLADDSGPATRLLSNTRLTMPNGFGADLALGVYRSNGLSTAPEAPFTGLPTLPPMVGAQAGVYRIDGNQLSWLQPLRAAIANKPRPNKTDPPSGIEVAIPLAEVFPNGYSGPTVRFVGYLGTTGESSQFLTAANPLRSSLGGRPLATSWISNQFLPSMPNINSDLGTNPITLLGSGTLSLAEASELTSQVEFYPEAVTALGNGRYRQQLTFIYNGSGFRGASYLRVEVPNTVTVVNASAKSVRVSGGILRLEGRGLNTGAKVSVTVEYQSPSPSFTPAFGLFTGNGLL